MPQEQPSERPDYGINGEEEERPDYVIGEEVWPAPLPSIEDEEEGQDEEEKALPRQQWEATAPTEFLQKTHESNLLQTLSSLITKRKQKPDPLAEIVKDVRSPLCGKSLKELETNDSQSPQGDFLTRT